MTSFIKFPDDLIAIPKFPGYCWHITEEKLYSFKYGELRALKLGTAWWHQGKLIPPCYRISREGIRHNLYPDILKKIAIKQTTVGYKEV